jgi:hypothetical protein
VTNNPNTISGTVRFSNVNPAILSLLDAPGNEGLKYLYMTASSLPPAEPRGSSAVIDPPTSRLSSSYAITVDSDPAGIQYSVIPRASLIDNRETYYFNSRTSAPVFPVGVVPALNFSECLGVVTVRFRSSGGAAAAVDSGFSRGPGEHVRDRSRVHARDACICKDLQKLWAGCRCSGAFNIPA